MYVGALCDNRALYDNRALHLWCSRFCWALKAALSTWLKSPVNNLNLSSFLIKLPWQIIFLSYALLSTPTPCLEKGIYFIFYIVGKAVSSAALSHIQDLITIYKILAVSFLSLFFHLSSLFFAQRIIHVFWTLTEPLIFILKIKFAQATFAHGKQLFLSTWLLLGEH